MRTLTVDLQPDQEVHMLYDLVLIGPLSTHEYGYVLGRLHASLLRETEENLTDVLPEGYSVRIREWDEED